MVQRLRLLPVTARASHFHLRPGSAILQLAVPLVTVKADSAAAFPRLAREKGSRPVVAAVVFSARSSPEFARFAFVPCLGSICLAIADLVIAAADTSYRRFSQLRRVDKEYCQGCNVPCFANRCHA